MAQSKLASLAAMLEALKQAWNELHNLGASDAILSDIRAVLVNAGMDPKEDV